MGLGEALEGGGFVGKFGEDLVELRDLQNFFHLWRKADHFHRAARFHHIQIGANEFADAGAIEIIERGEIQKNIFVALLEQPLDGFSQGLGLKKREAAADLDKRNGVCLPDINGEIHGRDLWPKGRGDSTLKWAEGKMNKTASFHQFLAQLDADAAA